MKHVIVSFWRRMLAVASALLFGIFCVSCREKNGSVDVAKHQNGLLANPAYQIHREDGLVELVTGAGRAHEVRYRLDEYSSALWEALHTPRSPPPEDGASPFIALTEAEMVQMMQARFPTRDSFLIRDRVMAFLEHALAEGIILRADAQVRFETGSGAVYIEFQPPRDAKGSK